MKKESYYNKNSMDFYNKTISVDMSNLYKPFLQQVKKGGHILDAGCGSGRDSLYFINHGYKVTAIDASYSMVKLASEKKLIWLNKQESEHIICSNFVEL